MKHYNRIEHMPKEKGNGYLERVIAGDKMPASIFFSKYIEKEIELQKMHPAMQIAIPVSKNGIVGTLGTADFEVKDSKDSEYVINAMIGVIWRNSGKNPELKEVETRLKSAKKAIYVDAVASIAPNRNVAFDMLEEISRIGRMHGADIAYMESTNPIMDHVCEKNGWTRLYRTVTGNSFFIKFL